MKKKIICFALAVMMLVLAVPTFADTVPSNAKVYGAGTCHTGFTTSRYLSVGNGWNLISISCTYVIWDDAWSSQNYEIVTPREGNADCSDPMDIATGMSSQNGGAPVSSGASTNQSYYTPNIVQSSLYDSAYLYAQTIRLRIEKPTDSGVYNMKCWGYFWKS